jgi:hypothetical protein
MERFRELILAAGALPELYTNRTKKAEPSDGAEALPRQTCRPFLGLFS